MLIRNCLVWLAPLVVIGCGGSDTPVGLTVFPATTLYTGVEDTGMKYTVNMAVSGASAVTWATGDATIATVTGTAQSATITGVKEGSTTVTATAGTETKSVPVQVKKYAAADRMAGQAAWTMFSCAKS